MPYVIVTMGADSIGEADPEVELFVSKEVARLALTRKYAETIREHHENYGEEGLTKRVRRFLTLCDATTVAQVAGDRFWRSMEYEWNDWYQTAKIDLDWYTTYWLIEVAPGINPLAPERLPGL